MDKGGIEPANDNTLVGWLQSYLIIYFSVIPFLKCFKNSIWGNAAWEGNGFSASQEISYIFFT
jgi:hypothetical protein